MTSSAADVAALTSVGLRIARPLVAVVVVAFPPVVDANRVALCTASRATVVARARRKLLDDLRAQAAALDAIGVGGTTFGHRRLADTDRVTGYPFVELTATGVALSATGRTPATGRMFRTAQSATGLVTLIRSGWMAADVVAAGDVQARRAADRSLDAQVVTSRANAEIPGATHIVTAARSAVRTDLRRQAAALGADGLLVGRFETYWSSTWHRVEVVASAEAIVRWRRGANFPSVSRALGLGAVGQ